MLDSARETTHTRGKPPAPPGILALAGPAESLQSAAMRPDISIETSCPRGSLALGRGDDLVETVRFDAARRHATQVIARLAEMVRAAGLGPRDLAEVYVSVGPGSFTGVRVGVTVARTLAQALPGVRCVAVPTAAAVAENARERAFEHLGVVLDAREGRVYFAPFARRGARLVGDGPAGVVAARDLLRRMPILLIGPALQYEDLRGHGVRIGDPRDEALHLARADNVWRVGRRMARAGEFTPYPQVLPIYPRKPEAVRLWEQRSGAGR